MVRRPDHLTKTYNVDTFEGAKAVIDDWSKIAGDKATLVRAYRAVMARLDEVTGQLAGVLGVIGYVRRERPAWSEFTTIEMADTLARCIFPDGIPPEVQAHIDRLADESEPAREESIRLYGSDDHDPAGDA